uniref:Uncharacterized protein n=1 Tax=Arundo donax TaxID=35708 RepID=A0A0A9C6G5_ARUDO
MSHLLFGYLCFAVSFSER